MTVRNLAGYFDTKAKFLDYKPNDTASFNKQMRDLIYRDDNKVLPLLPMVFELDITSSLYRSKRSLWFVPSAAT